nr:addiction module toxin, GnsA/GnsB family [Escherichia coli]
MSLRKRPGKEVTSISLLLGKKMTGLESYKYQD